MVYNCRLAWKLSVALPRVLYASLQGAELEKQAEGIVVLESRIEVAEGERGRRAGGNAGHDAAPGPAAGHGAARPAGP